MEHSGPPHAKLSQLILRGLQNLSRAVRPALMHTGALRVARRLLRGKPSRLRHIASNVLDPPGSPGTARAPFDGATILVMPGEEVGRQIAYRFRTFESFELDLFSTLVRNGDVVFDVGANVGLYSVLAAKRLEGGALHAFEPNPAVFEILRENVTPFAERCSIHVHQKAVGAEPGKVKLLCMDDSAFSSVVDTRRRVLTKEVEVVQTTLDDVVTAYRLPRVDLLKVDVEGYEPEVLAGGQQLLSREDAPILLIEIAAPNLRPRGRTQLEVVGVLESLGYEVLLAEAGLRPARELPWSEAGVRQENFVAVKPARAERLRVRQVGD